MKRLIYSFVIVSVVFLALFTIGQLSTAQNKSEVNTESENQKGIQRTRLSRTNLTDNIWTQIAVNRVGNRAIGNSVTATDASNSSVANPRIQTAPSQTFEGTLEIVWGDPQPGSGSGGDIRYALRLADGSVVPLQLTGQEGEAVFYFRKRVLVSGRAVQGQAAAGNVGAAATLIVDTIAPSQALQSVSSPDVVGTKKVIYLLAKFSDDTAVPHPPAFYTNLNNPDTPPAGEVFPTTINAFYKKISGNQFSWVGVVGGVGGVGAAGGWLTLPHPKSFYANCGWSTSCANLVALGDDATALGRAQGINFTVYDNINFVLSNDLDCCAWGGGYFSSVDNKSYGATWEPPWGQNTDTYGHEMGHSLGLPHSGWVYYAYDSPWDLMSNRRTLNNVVCGSYNSINSGNAPRNLICSEPGDGYIIDHRDYLGWIPAANQVVTNTSSAGITVAVEANALPITSAIKEIKICLPAIPCTGPTAHYFTVEARVKGLGATSQFDNAIPGEGVIIHDVLRNRPPISGTCFFNSQSGWAMPIDATPGDYNSATCTSSGALSNAQWLPGQTYTNATYGLNIAVLSRTGSTFMVAIGGGVGRKPFDFDGDGKADVSVFRLTNGTWYFTNSSNGAFNSVQFGTNGDLIAPADFDGDGRSDISVFRPSIGTWYRLNSSNNAFVAVQFGQTGDSPVPGDFDGDGRADISVFRPSIGTWYRLNSSNGQFVPVQFGANGDKPQIGDFDGDGKTDLAVFRPSTSVWHVLRSSDGTYSGTAFGQPGDIATPSDYEGDGKADISVFRPSTGTWYRLNSSNGQVVPVQFGANGDVPAPADFDGDGKADPAVFRPSNGYWYLLRSTAGFTGQQFGSSGDIPTPAAFGR